MVETNSRAVTTENLLGDLPNKNDTDKIHLGYAWSKIIAIIYLHASLLYAIYIFPEAKFQTLIFTSFLTIFGGLGITAGVHRLWTHRSYKAKLPLRILLGVFQTLAFQDTIYEWVRDHRVHHKYSETNADPHNAKRGLFYAHIGWLMLKRHPDNIDKGNKIQLDDLLQDPVVTFQMKYYMPAAFIISIFLPIFIPYYFWNESLLIAYYIAVILRHTIIGHATALVNSVAHLHGDKPYDVSINPVENSIVRVLSLGEGSHNFHHVFPQDYATSEYGSLNFTKKFIDLMACLGLVYDRNVTSEETILKRRIRTGNLMKTH